MITGAKIAAIACLVAVVSLAAPLTHHVAHAQHQAVTPVPLESLTPIDPAGIVVIPPGNSAHFQGQPITHGLQGDGHIAYDLSRRYTTFSGTVYIDDGSTCGGFSGNDCHFSVFDESQAYHSPSGDYQWTTDHPLFDYSFSSSITTITFSINVQGVSLIEIDLTGGATTDLVATLTPVSHNPQPKPLQTHVQAISPNVSRAVPSNRAILFQWQSFRGATAYQLHAWLVHPLGNSSIQQGTPTTFAVTVYGKATYVWQDRSFLPGLYQYELLPVNRNGYALADWSRPTEFKIIG